MAADFILVHGETGAEILLNRDQIVSAELLPGGLTSVKLTNGDTILIREGHAALRIKT